MLIPDDYQPGYARARLADPAMAETYLRHTTLGDPEADAVTALLLPYPAEQQRDWLRLGVEQGPAALDSAPAGLRDFFAGIEAAPPWFDAAAALPGCRAFHRNSEMFIGAFVAAVLIEGFATLISKSFSITGRLVDQGVRRLKQNNLHLVEIFMPGGLDRHGDGWRLSVRIRLMHARIRQLLAQSPEWEGQAWGTPLSAAHIGYATASFSGLLLQRARMLGVELSDAERQSFMMVWRYAGQLMGVPPALACATEAEAMRLRDIGILCEPPPGIESILLANNLINSAPIVADITEPAARRALSKRIYQVSRALIGDTLADQLNYPPSRRFGVLGMLRLTNRTERLLRGWFPALERYRRFGQFQRMLDVSFHSPTGISYRMPGHLHAERDRPAA